MKTRFAPSPTGLIHFGNLRTALFNFLLAKSQNGDFLLRIEDTDFSRSKSEYIESLLQDLKDMQIEFTEGPGKETKLGPFKQSERMGIYDKYYHLLEQHGFAYKCFCSEQQLAISRKAQLSLGKPPRYPGTCRNLTQAEINIKLSQGLQPTLRFNMQKIPANEIIEFDDLIKGKQRFLSADIGDFIIRRADNTASFMFANAIDDSLMQVTHALRGDDHLTNTPRQLAILRALHLAEPQYGHFPLIYGGDGAPLSKRNGSAAVRDLLTQGYLPLALLNYLARLGHYYANQKFLTIEELSRQFDLKNVSGSPAKHDVAHLKYWQKEAMMQADPEHLWEIIQDIVQKLDIISKWKIIQAIEQKIEQKLDMLSKNESSGRIIKQDIIDIIQDIIDIINASAPKFALAAEDLQLQSARDVAELCWDGIAAAYNIPVNYRDMVGYIKAGGFAKIASRPKALEFVVVIKPNLLMPTDAMQWVEVFFADKLDFSTQAQKIIRAAGFEFFDFALTFIQQHKSYDFASLATAMQAGLKVQGKHLFKPLRVALTGKEHGPELGPVVTLLQEKTCLRLQQAREICGDTGADKPKPPAPIKVPPIPA